MSKKNIFIALTLVLFFLNVSFAYGQGLVPVPTGEDGNYQINDFIVLAINISNWIMGMVGSLSLIMFIYGGFMFLVSGGASDKIQEAKKIIVAAVIGLIIVFTSFLIIKFVLGTLGINWTGGTTINK